MERSHIWAWFEVRTFSLRDYCYSSQAGKPGRWETSSTKTQLTRHSSLRKHTYIHVCTHPGRTMEEYAYWKWFEHKETVSFRQYGCDKTGFALSKGCFQLGVVYRNHDRTRVTALNGGTTVMLAALWSFDLGSKLLNLSILLTKAILTCWCLAAVYNIYHIHKSACHNFNIC